MKCHAAATVLQGSSNRHGSRCHASSCHMPPALHRKSDHATSWHAASPGVIVCVNPRCKGSAPQSRHRSGPRVGSSGVHRPAVRWVACSHAVRHGTLMAGREGCGARCIAMRGLPTDRAASAHCNAAMPLPRPPPWPAACCSANHSGASRPSPCQAPCQALMPASSWPCRPPKHTTCQPPISCQHTTFSPCHSPWAQTPR